MKLGIIGANGRMGQMLLREIASGAWPCTLGAAIDVASDKEAAFKVCDAFIDFSAVEGVAEHAGLAAKFKKPLVVGTTGLGEKENTALAAASKVAPVLRSYNMSLGVNLLAALVEQAAARLGPAEFDIEVFEAHHRHKVDAPSGTALLLAGAAAEGRGVELKDVIAGDRAGARKTGDIGMSVFRGGDVVGDHVVTFAGMGERIEFTHKASDRAIFARGAIRAALWLKDKPAGLYSMKDMLGL